MDISILGHVITSLNSSWFKSLLRVISMTVLCIYRDRYRHVFFLCCPFPPLQIQNNLATSFNGGYPARNDTEQHPFHLHGHHFWVLGSGTGVFNKSDPNQTSSLNLINPVYRDTQMVCELFPHNHIPLPLD